MDAALSTLSKAVLWFIEDQLSNNDDADDDELKDCFIKEGLTPDQADHALTYRPRYAMNIYVDGLTPIRHGTNARRYNPRTHQIEPDQPA